MSETRKPEEYGVVTEPRTLRFERVLPGPVERVWEYLANTEKRTQWLAAGSIDLVVGGKVELVFRHSDLSPFQEVAPAKFTQDEYASSGKVTRCEPPRLLGITWNDAADHSEVLFELTPQGEDVLFVLTHRNLGSREEMVDVSGGWHSHLDVLADIAYDRPRRRFWSIWEGLEEEYARRLPSE